jgi:filamin
MLGFPLKLTFELPFDSSKVMALGPGLPYRKVRDTLLARPRSSPMCCHLAKTTLEGASFGEKMSTFDSQRNSSADTEIELNVFSSTKILGSGFAPQFTMRCCSSLCGCSADVFREATTDFTVDSRPLTQVGGDHIKAHIDNPSGASTECFVTDNADGTYQVEYTPFEKGALSFPWM